MTRTEKLGIGSLAIALVSCALAALVVPEVRTILGLPLDPVAVRSPAGQGEQTGGSLREATDAQPAVVPTTLVAENATRRYPVGGAGQTRVPGETAPPGETVALSRLRVHSAVASSTLPPSRVARYVPEMALDGSGATPWVENAAGQGIGEWIEMHLGATRAVTRLEISNGYDKGSRYGENGRIRSITAHFSGGETRTFSLEDRPGPQEIQIGLIRTSSIRLVINTTYPGSRWEDTALGDVRVIGF